jgi:hypothetical protein
MNHVQRTLKLKERYKSSAYRHAPAMQLILQQVHAGM